MSWPQKPVVHGGARRGKRAPEYNAWAKMRARCTDPKNKDFKNYGARGIRVCDGWSDFAMFAADMGQRPSPKHTIERTNNDLGYSPDNCVWATRDVQSRNRRPRTLRLECTRGHALAGDNLYIRPDNGKRQCRACRALAMDKFYGRSAA